MKKLGFSLVLLSFFLLAFAEAVAQKTYGNLYHPEADATVEIATAVGKAASEKKHVLLQIGGNWCVWCYRLHDFIEKDEGLKSILKENYVSLHINYSKENENLAVLEKYGFPQRFGFLVLVILDATGKRLHTQDTALLEEGDGYDLKKVKFFFESWTPKSVAPESYTKPPKG